MNARKNWIMAFLVFSVVLGSIPALAQDDFAFKREVVKTVFPGDDDWVTCAAVAFTPPGTGYVVVTASGFADFQRDDSYLELTLSTKARSKGRWVFKLTPGYQFFQTYSVRLVFPVQGGNNYTFYLNGRSANGTGNWIDVKTGSLTAEFHHEDATQRAAVQPSEVAPEERAPEEASRVHRH